MIRILLVLALLFTAAACTGGPSGAPDAPYFAPQRVRELIQRTLPEDAVDVRWNGDYAVFYRKDGRAFYGFAKPAATPGHVNVSLMELPAVSF